MKDKIFNFLFKKQRTDVIYVKRNEGSFLSDIIEKKPQNADDIWGFRGEFYNAVFSEHREIIL